MSRSRSPRERPGGGLVEHHQLRVGGARHADLELALLAVRERADERVQRVGQPDALGRGAGALALLALARGRVSEPQAAAVAPDDGEVEVVLDREPGEQPGLLVRPGDAQRSAARAPGRSVTSVPITSIVPVVGGKSPAIRLNSVVLPAPFGPEDGAALAVRDVEIDVAHGLHPTEAPADPPQAEDRTGAFGGDGSRRLSQRVTVTRLDLRDLPGDGCPSRTPGLVPLGGGFVGENTPPNVCGTSTTL